MEKQGPYKYVLQFTVEKIQVTFKNMAKYHFCFPHPQGPHRAEPGDFGGFTLV